MPKTKRSSAAKSVAPVTSFAEDESFDEALTDQFAQQAIELASEDERSPALPAKLRDLRRGIAKSLRQQQDDVLYEALERARDQEPEAYTYLRALIEETAETVFFTRHERSFEVNAFVIPMFVRTVGGLDANNNFRDADAFTELTASIKAAGLESPDAQVVLVSYAYHLDEIDALTYSHLEAMVRDAYAAMTDKKITATPAIDRSMRGWPEKRFQADDLAVELRFLLGFALKPADDPFYVIPQGEAAMDDYFAERARRFQAWSETAGTMLRGCLTAPGHDGEFDVHFLYQDLFHGGKERGIAEYLTLQMMSELDHALGQNGVSAQQTHAVIGPVHLDGEDALRLNLYRDDTVVATLDRPLGTGGEMQTEIDDVYDALLTMGVRSVGLADKFDAAGTAVNVRPLS